jgi:hypothetical protein
VGISSSQTIQKCFSNRLNSQRNRAPIYRDLNSPSLVYWLHSTEGLRLWLSVTVRPFPFHHNLWENESSERISAEKKKETGGVSSPASVAAEVKTHTHTHTNYQLPKFLVVVVGSFSLRSGAKFRTLALLTGTTYVMCGGGWRQRRATAAAASSIAKAKLRHAASSFENEGNDES